MLTKTSDVTWEYKGYEISGTPTARERGGKRIESYDWLYKVRDASGKWMHEGYYDSRDAAKTFIDSLAS
jgi:hypothetical protein